MIGPINGEINMAPMITAVEFTFKPSDAMKMASLALWPFGKEVRSGERSNGCLYVLMNILWIFLGGIWICLSHLEMCIRDRNNNNISYEKN